MKEIKFRYWNYMKKEMTYQDIHGMVLGKMGTNIDEKYLMQFTGLKDKNGKDIYEGDIVKATDYSSGKSYLCDVIWEQETCTSGYSLKSIGWYREELEIVGNIHQNTDLLKQLADEEENDD